MLAALTAAVLLAAHPTATPTDPPKDGTELIQRMHAAYDGKWYRSLRFVQKTSFPDGRVETWYETATMPGRLRIDIAPLEEQHAILFRSDSVYRIEQGAVKAAQAMVHPLMVLGFDVYVQAPSVTAAKLAGLGFDLGKLREDTWQGRKAWVVGTAMGDSVAREFWIDQERLVFVRMIQSAPRKDAPGKRDVAEILFNRYEKIGKGWIAPEVVFYRNGEKMQMEEYSEMQVDVPVEEASFDPAAFTRPGWIR